MRLKTIQWNIGGGKIRTHEAPAGGPYTDNGIEHIVEVLKRYEPDIVTLQEAHTDDASAQAELIAKSIDLPHVVNDPYDDSHIEAGQKLSQAILSRFPLSAHTFEFFVNPKLNTIGPDGSQWISHDKGITTATAQIPERRVSIATLHLIPFRKFGINPLDDTVAELRTDIENLVKPRENTFLLQGDFNIESASLRTFLPQIFAQNIEEILQNDPTTPKGQALDHILFRGMSQVKSDVATDVLTDHFPLYSEFEL